MRIALAALLLAGCSALNPCMSLDERVCADLGPADCEVWRTNPAISTGMLPGSDFRSRRATAANVTCELWLEEGNYRTATLPTVVWRIRNARDPDHVGPAPSVGRMNSPGPPLGIPPWTYYLLAPVCIVGILVRFKLGQRS